MKVVIVQEPEKLIQLIEQLEMPDFCFEERVGIAKQLREVIGAMNEHAPPGEERSFTLQLLSTQQVFQTVSS